MPPKNYLQLKIGVLVHLRDLFHRQARTKEILPLELIHVAADLKTSEEDVSSTIAELIELGFAKPTSHPHLAVTDGEVAITAAGLTELHSMESRNVIPPSWTSLRPILSPVSRHSIDGT